MFVCATFQKKNISTDLSVIQSQEYSGAKVRLDPSERRRSYELSLDTGLEAKARI